MKIRIKNKVTVKKIKRIFARPPMRPIFAYRIAHSLVASPEPVSKDKSC